MTHEMVFELAHRYGVAIEYADLGDWGEHELRSEYDPDGPTIRVNRRVTARLTSQQVEHLVAFAVAHELYHHRERLGEVRKLSSRAKREAAANAFARALIAE